MKDIENPDGSKSDKVKLIRSESIGNYAWDSSNTNDWEKSSLQKILNSGDYYNRTNSFENTGLTNKAKNMISTSVWNLGGTTSYDTLKVKDFYEAERGTAVSSGRPTKWTGNVGLIYPSDYGYAVESNRNTCLDTVTNNWDGNDCYRSIWIMDLSSTYWTLTPLISSNNNQVIYFDMVLSSITATFNNKVVPVVYLNSNVMIGSNGEGTITNPFTLS